MATLPTTGAPPVTEAPASAPEPGFEGLQEVSAPAAPSAAVEPGFEGLEEINADAGFEGLQEADRLDLEDDLALSNDDNFRPAQFISENPSVAQEPERFKKLLNVYRQKRIKGLEFGKVAKAAVTEAPGIVGKVVKGAGQLASRVVDIGVSPAVNEVLGFVTGTDMTPLREETRRRQLKGAAEITAGTEQAVTGITQLAQQGGRKLFGTSPEKATDSELYDDLLVDSEFHKLTQQISQGQSELSQSIGLDAEFLTKNGVTLDPKAIENLSLVDPLTLVATGGIFKVVGVGGKVLATAATRAGAQAVINGVKTAGGRALQVAGQGTAAAGRAVQKLPLRTPGMVATGGTLATGNIPGAIAAAAAPAVVKASGRALERAGQVVSEVGQAVTPGFIGPPTAATARILEMAASPAARAAKTVAAGATAGTVLAAPLALAADESQTAGAILGGGAALGALAGTTVVAGRGIANVVAKKYLDPHSIPLQPVESRGYGVDANLDRAHEAAVKSLSAPEQNAINNFREALRAQGGEIYAQDGATYLERVRETLRNEDGVAQLTPEREALAQTYADTHAFFDGNITDAAGNTRRVVFLNSGAKGLPHDAGHLFQALMSPERQAQLRQAVLDSYTPQQLQEFAQGYQQRLGDANYFSKLGEEAGLNKVADEIIAENFSQIFGNSELSNLKAPPKLLETLGRTAAEAAETLGFDLTAGRTTPDLGVTPTFGVQNLLRNAAREVLNLPPEKPQLTLTKATLPEKVPTAADIVAPVSPDAPVAPRAEPVIDAAAKRSQETGIAEARELVKDSPETTATVDTISKSMEAGNPALRIEHRGITAETPTPSGEARGGRRSTQAKGYAELEALQIENRANAPEEIVSVHEKTFVPVRWVNQGGKATLIAMSVDKVIGNVRKIVTEAAVNKAEKLIPYESVGGELTPDAWNQAIADIKTYAENQSNGYRGDGSRLVRPSDEAGVSIPAENPNYTPKKLGEAQANFANLVQGLAPPQTARAVKGTVPGNVKAQLVAEANLRTPQPVAKISAKDISKQTFPKPFEGRTIKETNPLRNELSSRGVNVRALTEVTERFAAQDIASVGEAAPSAQMKAPVTDVIRGGFLPKEAELSAIRNGQKEGETFNADGTIFTPTPGSNLDVVTLASSNVPLANLNEGAVASAMGPFQSAFRDPNVKAGVFRLATPGPDGQPQASIDVNVLVDQKNRDLATAFAKANRQESIFDLTKLETVPTGGDGQTVLKSSSEVAAAAKALSEGRMVSPEEIARVATDNKPLAEVGEKILSYPAEEWTDIATTKWGGGYTQEAYRLGLGLKEATDVALLAGFRDRAMAEFRSRMNAGDLDGAYPFANKSQFFAEAYGAATGTGSAKRGVRLNGFTQPHPFPAGEGPKFLAAGQAESGVRDAISKLPAVKSGFVRLYHGEGGPQGGGTGGAFYAASAEKASSFGPRLSWVDVTVDAAQKAFNKAKQTGFSGGDNFVLENADLQRSKQLDASVEPPTFDLDSVQFLPKKRKVAASDIKPVKRDEQGRPLTSGGLVDYDKLAAERTAERKAQEAADMSALDAGKYNTPEGATVTQEATGWVLPDGNFVPIDAAYHQDWLARNSAQLNEDFGTKFSEKASVEERLDALNSGFVRVRDNRGADTVIELNSRFWKGDTKKKVEDLLLNQPNDVFPDRFTVTLLDNEGNTVDSASARLFDSENPRQDATEALAQLKAGTAERRNVGPTDIQRARAMGQSFDPKFLPKEGEEKYVVIWKPRKEGKTTFRKEVMASSPEEARAKGVEKGGHFVETFTEESVNQAAQKIAPSVIRNLEDRARSEESGGKFLPKEGPEFNDYVAERIRDSKKHPEALPLDFRKDDKGNYVAGFNDEPTAVARDYALRETPLAKRVKTEEKLATELSKGLVREYTQAKKNPEIAAGETWYSLCREKLANLLGDDTKLFAELLGATSPQTDVNANFNYALDAYNQFKTGAYDKMLEKYREGKDEFAAGNIGEFSKATGKTGKKATLEAFLYWWADKHNLIPTSPKGKRFGMNSRAVLRVLDGSWASQVKGPKTPNFTGNLSGQTFEATIDVWAMRLLHRLANEGNAKRWRIQPGNESGVTDKDFFLGQKAFRQAADKIGIQPDALQAMLWFAEKEYWTEKGWTSASGKKKSDFNVLLDATERTEIGTLRRVDKQLSFSDIEKKP